MEPSAILFAAAIGLGLSMPATAADEVKTTLQNGRLSFETADGEFSASLRALVQFDAAYYLQEDAAKALPAAYGPDLSSGSNFRRAFIGVQGKIFGDWSYNFTYDFGGSATESSGHIYSAYLQYDGLGALGFRIGAYAPPAGIEDGTGASDLMFLERSAPANLARGIAGNTGRQAISAIYADKRTFAALSLSGGKVGDTAAYDEQMAVLGRVSHRLFAGTDFDLLLDVDGTYVFKLPDAAANDDSHSIKLSDYPELTVDSTATKLINTGSLTAERYYQWGIEAAARWRNLYFQGGYFAYYVDRAATSTTVYSSATDSQILPLKPDDNRFDGWYLQGSWVLTGETRAYKTANGAFAAPKPAKPFSLKTGGWGAWEIAARYSDLNLNDNAADTSAVVTGWSTSGSKTYTFYNAVRGGEQKGITLGLNWYPNQAIRFAFDYQWIDIDRMQTAGTTSTTGTPVMPAVSANQKMQMLALRVQLAF